MIKTAFCTETGCFVDIKDYDPSIHKNLFCTEWHPLTPKKGNIMTHHYAHQVNTTCKHQNKTEWHLRWQSLSFQTEVRFHTSSTSLPSTSLPSTSSSTSLSAIQNTESKLKIADIISKENRVIEIQHSPIKEDEVKERENTYGDMIWIFDVRNSVTGTEFICRCEKYCLIKPNKRYLFYSTKETYFDCGKYLLKKKERLGKYILCEINNYKDFCEVHFDKIYPYEDDFEFAFIVDRLIYQNNKLYFSASFPEDPEDPEDLSDYSPFQESKYVPFRYFLPY